MPLAPMDVAPANRFNLMLDNCQIGSFSELTGITSEIEVIEYRTISAQGAHILKKMPGNRKPPTIILKRGKDEDSQKLFAWHESAVIGAIEAARQPASIEVRDYQNNPIFEYVLENAWCSKITLSGLKANANEIVTEEVTIVCERIVRKGFDPAKS